MAIWPLAPQLPQVSAAVKFCCSGHSQCLCSDEPQFLQRAISSSRRVPLRAASSRSCIRFKSFCPSGASTPCLIITFIYRNAWKMCKITVQIWQKFIVTQIRNTLRLADPNNSNNCTKSTHFFTDSWVCPVTNAWRISSSPAIGRPSRRPWNHWLTHVVRHSINPNK